MAAADGGETVGEQRLRPPSLFMMLAEARSIFELNSSLLLSPLLLRAPKGDGHPVLALPGFLARDLSMAPLRRYLKELGYDTHAWNMGRNLGADVGNVVVHHVRQVVNVDATCCNMGDVTPSLAGPKRPQDRIELGSVASQFASLFSKPIADNGFNQPSGMLATRPPAPGR